MNDNTLARTLKELKIMHEQKFEQILREIQNNPERFNDCKKDLFEDWGYFLRLYQKVIEDEVHIANTREYVLLGFLVEGLIKIILFSDSPEKYLNIKKWKRTLGKLRDKLTESINEPDETKIAGLEDSLKLITELRNNFIHYPFYCSLDYRFRWLFFQVFAYLLDRFSLWEYLDNSEVIFIKKIAFEKPTGVSLLEVDLYGQ
jgi:hypothetical protein